MIVALQYGHKDIAQILLAQTELGDLTLRNSKGADALLFACMEGMAVIVERLLFLGVRPSCTPTSHPVYNLLSDQSLVCSALSIAVFNGRQAVVKMLLDVCEPSVVVLPFPFITLKSIQRGKAGATDVTPLSLACAMGRLGVLRELLWRDCMSVANVDSDRSTVLHHLCRAKEDVVDIFMELGRRNLITDALLHSIDALGDSALHVAVDNKQEGLVPLLLDEGLLVTTKNALTGGTALHVAVKRKSLQLVRVLLEYGADPLAANLEGKSSLDLAGKLRADSDIYMLMSQSAATWRNFRGISSKAKSEATDQAHTPVETTPSNQSPSTRSETVPDIEEPEAQPSSWGEDDVTEFSPLDDSFLDVTPTPLCQHQLGSTGDVILSVKDEICVVSSASLAGLDSPEATKESDLLAASPTAMHLRPVPPSLKDSGTSFKRGATLSSSTKSSAVELARSSPSKQPASVVCGSSSLHTTPVKSAPADAIPSALPLVTPASPASAKVARPSVRGRPSAASIYLGSAKMPAAPSSSRKENRSSMALTKK